MWLQQLSGDIHEEVDNHNRMLDNMVCTVLQLTKVFNNSSSFFVFCINHLSVFMQGNDMDSSRGVLSGTMDKFKMVCTWWFFFPIVLYKRSISIYLYWVYTLVISPAFLNFCVLWMFQVFETKSSRRMFSLVASFVVIFLIIYYLTR